MRHMPAHDLTVAEIDRQSLFHPFTALAEHQHAEPLVMDEAQGVWVRDLGGRRYLDAAAGLWCVNIGYGRREVAEAMYREALRLSFCHSFGGAGNEPAIRLSDRLLRLAPDGMARISSATPARTPTTPTSSSPGTTTSCAASRRS